MSESPMMVLAILDGWGIGRKDATNPIYQVNPKSIRYVKEHYLVGSVQSSGIAVGLPWNEVGNSEVGHLTIGAGKVIYQHYPRISLAIQRGEFFKNKVFLEACEHVKKTGGALNLAGLLTEGSVHASFDHLEALVQLAAQQKVSKVHLHLFADGKDSRPHSLLQLLERLRRVTDASGVGTLATVIGRHFALDRDSHWDRTKEAYDAMTGMLAPTAVALTQIANTTYDAGYSDEFLPATVLGPEVHPITDGDALIFFDFREDSIRQIVESFVAPEFDKFPVKKFENLYVATMVEYTKHFKVPVAFPTEVVEAPLGKVLSDAGKTQLLIAETEKYAHVTFFFNAYRDEPFPGQTKFLVPSRNVQSHAEEPQMMAAAIADKVVEAIRGRLYDVIIVNFANADMVAHTGNYNATVKAIETIDEQYGRVVQACEEAGAYLVTTADHGNAEVLIDAMTGSPETTHDPNQVPLYIVGPEFKRKNTLVNIEAREAQPVGILSDVAPTILELMKIKKPASMTGESLLEFLR